MARFVFCLDNMTMDFSSRYLKRILFEAILKGKCLG